MDIIEIVIPFKHIGHYESTWLSNEIREWLELNIGIGILTGTIEIMRHNHYKWSYELSRNGTIFYFRNATDAILFKLTWY
jgi:hypothetical protein